jgi:hypothetical protein
MKTTTARSVRSFKAKVYNAKKQGIMVKTDFDKSGKLYLETEKEIVYCP